jgi:predicted dienelactone hydrolase
MLRSGTHFSSSEDADVASFPRVLVGQNLAIGRSYLQTMSVAFFKTYLSDRPQSSFQPYLTATYAQSISQSAMPLYLIQSITATQLEQAYGKTPPVPIVPNAIAVR